MYKNILILSAGRRVELVKIFQNHAKKYRNINIYTADSNPLHSPACQINNKFFELPKCNKRNYIDILIKKSLSNKIKLIIPTIDDELTVISKNKEIFLKYKINVAISDLKFINKSSNKLLTKKIFDELSIKYPKIYQKNKLNYPLIIKPIYGSSSKNISIIKNKDELSKSLLKNKKVYFSKYIERLKEYTIDLYYDRKNNLINLVARERLDVRNGEVIKSITNKKLSINLFMVFKNLKDAKGPITAQLFYNHKTNDIYGIEINPRLGGGVTLSYKAGLNFPKYLIDEYINNKTIKTNLSIKDRLLLLRYEKDLIK